ncbi:MAG: threonine/serine exporter family protein [Candidatus Onthomorpha sp.]|nr:threonine/serine exporter family protein [Candidatus Onthomorpha sp.]
MKDNVMEVASMAGRIMLENGAEIARVEEVMSRIATHYGTDSCNFFVLSNGIFTTDSNHAKVEHIPFHGSQFDKVVEVCRVSRQVERGQLSIQQCEARLQAIRRMNAHPATEQIFASALGSAGFCAIFGGGIVDCAVSFVCGLLLWIYIIALGNRYMSKITSNIAGGMLVSLLCIVCHHLGIGHLGNIITGAIIPLVPGVPFTNGIRDLANEDYIAGATRLLDALMVFLCIAAGVSFAFMLDYAVMGEMIHIDGMHTDPFTSTWAFQIVASLVGTAAFAVLFGVPRRYYIDCGLCGMAGWLTYMVLMRLCGSSVVIATFFAAIVVAVLSYGFAMFRRCPVIVFLVCGIFPLVPGAGVFWTTYNVVSDQLSSALTTGFTALKLTFAIVFGIIIFMELRNRLKHTALKK